jgi:hypothetical protein
MVLTHFLLARDTNFIITVISTATTAFLGAMPGKLIYKKVSEKRHFIPQDRDIYLCSVNATHRKHASRKFMNIVQTVVYGSN